MQDSIITQFFDGVTYYTPYLIKMWIFFWIDLLKNISPWWPRKSIRGKLMLITGAGSGMGRESAFQFAKEGVRLVLWDVNTQGLEETKAALKQRGHDEVDIMTVNIGDHDAVKRAGYEVRERIGVPDLLFHVAGINGAFSLTECDMDKYDNTMNINTRSIVTITNEFLNYMIERNSGHIVALTSIAGYQGAGGLIAYSMSKFAAVGYMESVRNEMKAKKVDINFTTIAPYYVKTPLTRGIEYNNFWAPMCEPEYVIEQVVHAVLTNREEVYTPKWSWVYVVLRGVLPTRVMDLFTEAFEVHTLPVGFEKFRLQQQKEAMNQKADENENAVRNGHS